MSSTTRSKRNAKPIERLEGDLRVSRSRSAPRNSTSTSDQTNTVAPKQNTRKSVKKPQINSTTSTVITETSEGT
jgi:hypothetical protein